MTAPHPRGVSAFPPPPELDPVDHPPLTALELVELAEAALSNLATLRDTLMRDGREVRLDGTVRSLEEVGAALLDLAVAAEVIALGAPLAPHFPDGTARPPRPTPRQVLYLRGLAERAEEALRVHVEQGGDGPAPVLGPRRCEGITQTGERCGRRSAVVAAGWRCHTNREQDPPAV